jgi:subtilisin family serine protease
VPLVSVMQTVKLGLLVALLGAVACGGESVRGQGGAAEDPAETSQVGDVPPSAPQDGEPTFLGGDESAEQGEQSPDHRYVVRAESAAGKQAVAAVGGKVLLEVDPQTLAVELTPQAFEQLKTQPGIESVEADARRYALGQQVPYGVNMVEANKLAGATSSAPITVCVIDSGYAAAHEDLPRNATGNTDRGTGAWNVDACGHGTHVAGTIAAVNNGVGVVGVAANAVRIHVVKVFGDSCAWTYSSSLTRAVYECVQNGADVINMSLGGPSRSWAEEMAFEWAHLKGALSVAAAGNAGNTAKSYPASYEHVLSVAAVDSRGNVAAFSQRNDAVDLAAPGVGVLSTVPSSAKYAAWSGTSMAAPHVAGVAALVWSHNPQWTNTQVRDALVATAFDLWPAGRDDASGYGIVQAQKALARLQGTGGGNTTGTGSSNECTCSLR